MIFISFGKFRKKATKEMTTQVKAMMREMAREGVKFISFYWTLGRYDTVVIFEARDEKTVMKANIRIGDYISTETLVAVPRDEAIKLIE
jgi:uncharacterized protein with GYD domain